MKSSFFLRNFSRHMGKCAEGFEGVCSGMVVG